MILADDEKQEFIEQYKKEVFEGLESVDNPEFVTIIGAKGSGKTTMSAGMKNYAKISQDGVIAKYAEVTGEDIRESFFTKELSGLAMETVNELFKEAVTNNYNIIYESTVFNNTNKIMKNLERYGYSTKVKAIVVDEYVAAMNAEERNLDRKERFSAYKQGKLAYPNVNPFEITAENSMQSSLNTIEFLQELDASSVDLEVYEFGKKKPSYVKGKTHASFEDFVETVELSSMENNIKRAESLEKRANKDNDAEAFMRLRVLNKEMRRA